MLFLPDSQKGCIQARTSLCINLDDVFVAAFCSKNIPIDIYWFLDNSILSFLNRFFLF